MVNTRHFQNPGTGNPMVLRLNRAGVAEVVVDTTVYDSGDTVDKLTLPTDEADARHMSELLEIGPCRDLDIAERTLRNHFGVRDISYPPPTDPYYRRFAKSVTFGPAYPACPVRFAYGSGVDPFAGARLSWRALMDPLAGAPERFVHGPDTTWKHVSEYYVLRPERVAKLDAIVAKWNAGRGAGLPVATREEVLEALLDWELADLECDDGEGER